MRHKPKLELTRRRFICPATVKRGSHEAVCYGSTRVTFLPDRATGALKKQNFITISGFIGFRGLSMSPTIRTIVSYINSNLDRKLTLSDLARSATLSRSRMCSLFKKEMGMPPGQYVKTVRMQKAADLLERTSLTVTQIRAKIGMQDESRFVRAFKKVYGLAPSHYRARRTLL